MIKVYTLQELTEEYIDKFGHDCTVLDPYEHMALNFCFVKIQELYKELLAERYLTGNIDENSKN